MIGEAFSVLRANFGRLFSAGFLIYAVSLVLNIAFPTNVWIVILASFMPLWVTVAWIRLLVLDERYNPFLPVFPVIAVLKYFGVVIVQSLLYLLFFVIISYLTITILGINIEDFLNGNGTPSDPSGGAIAIAFTLIFGFLIVMAFVYVRMTPMLVSASTGKIIWFKECWRLTRGQTLNIFLFGLTSFGLLLLCMIPVVVIAIAIDMRVGGSDSVATEALYSHVLTFFLMMFWISWSTVFYRKITGLSDIKRVDEVFD